MTKFTVIGDIHCTLNNLDKVNQLFDSIEKLHNPTILLGDLLDTKSIIRSECLNLYYKRLQDSKLQFTILCGNHDLIRQDQEASSLEPLKALPNVTIVDYPQ